MGVRFAKYEAAGNDFILVQDTAPSAQGAAWLCDRRRGVGADGVIVVSRGRDAPLSFRLLNADGTEAEVSGNGLRCLGAFALAEGLVAEHDFDVETPAGPKRVTLQPGGATVDMGMPVFSPPLIPMKWDGESFLAQPFDLPDGSATACALSMGNPHLVLFVDSDPALLDLQELGPNLEHDPRFPNRTNVEFAHVSGDGIQARVWERGVGETLSCGTGACAVAVAANETGLAPPEVTVTFPGGPLTVTRTAEGVRLGGPVRRVFDGVVDLDGLA